MALALAIAGAGLTALFERHVMRTIADELDVHLRQLLSGIDVDTADRLVVNRPPVDPRFAEPMSGLYWQVGNEPGQLLRSRSLWDTTLALPADNLAPGEAHLHPAKGPNNASVLVRERKISLTVGGSRQNVRVAVAGNLDRVSRASSAFARELSAALGLLALTLGIATAVQVTLGLRPLGALQRGVADIRSGSASQLSSAVPSEVQPLVDELNGLLREQDGEVERSRGRAADLAHGLKTPLVALAADVTRLRALGQGGIAHDIEQIGDAMNRHVDRELARARVRGKSRTSTPYSTELLPLVRSLMATIERTPAGGQVKLEASCASGLRVPIDRADLAEVLGNLLDNAARHAASRVRLSATSESGRICISIDDDGPGIAPEVHAKVLERGVQLDERGGVAGLGLAIVQDVLDAYGWSIALESSDLGGLKVRLESRPSETGVVT